MDIYRMFTIYYTYFTMDVVTDILVNKKLL